jgi:hypothetical protein
MVVMVLVLCDITVVSLRVFYKPFDEINTINNRHINFYNILYSYLMHMRAIDQNILPKVSETPKCSIALRPTAEGNITLGGF